MALKRDATSKPTAVERTWEAAWETHDMAPCVEPRWNPGTRKVVGATGFEPATPCAQGRCATRLRYAPTPLILPRLESTFFDGLQNRRTAAAPAGPFVSDVTHSVASWEPLPAGKSREDAASAYTFPPKYAGYRAPQSDSVKEQHRSHPRRAE